VNTIHRIRTTATDESGRKIKYETFDKRRAQQRLAEVRTLDAKASLVHIPVKGR
jgi:hypothetical protein